MPQPSSTAFTFAGYLLAKSLSILAGAPCDELLVPIALVAKSNDPEFLIFEAKSQDEAVKKALATMKEAETTATNWALVHEGFARIGENRTDAFFVRLWTKGQAEPTLLVQSWKKQAASCSAATLTRIGPTSLVVEGKRVDLSNEQLAALENGVNSSSVEIEAWNASSP